MLDYIVFIGRFQPFHTGHLEVLQQALKLAKKVIVLVGSSSKPRSIKNPWSFEERKAMIMSSAHSDNVIALPLRDLTYNDQQWTSTVQRIITQQVMSFGWSDKTPSIGLIGCSKDSSSYYLKMFPQWGLLEHAMNDVVSATDIRSLYMSCQSMNFLKSVLSEEVYEYLKVFRESQAFQDLLDEYKFIVSYKKQWESSPYSPTFLTVDTIVIQSGHILLVRRKAQPGKGQLALPGGFVGQKENCEEAAIRELLEETTLQLNPLKIKSSIKASKLFDHPERSLRGRTVTEAFLIELDPGKLAEVKGGDDAEDAVWIPLSELREEGLYEDHYHIIQWFLGRV